MGLVLSSNLVSGDATPDRALRYPRILYESHYRSGTVTASGEQSDEFAADNATLDPSTWNFWRADALPATLEVELAAPAAADYCLLAAHTLGTEQATVTVDYWDGAAWVELHEVLPGDDKTLVILFDEVTATKYRIGLAGSDVPSIGVVQIGKALAMPRGVTLNHAPITLNRHTEHLTNISGTGAFLGRSVRRLGAATSIAFRHLAAAFIRDEFSPFIDHARTVGAFGWVWQPEAWPAEVAYCWTADDIRPAHDGMTGHLSVAFEVEGLID